MSDVEEMVDNTVVVFDETKHDNKQQTVVDIQDYATGACVRACVRAWCYFIACGGAIVFLWILRVCLQLLLPPYVYT
jgi:hypothetical protein